MESERVGMTRFLFSLLLIIGIALSSSAAAEFSAERAAFQATCGDSTLQYKVQTLLVLPGKNLCLKMVCPAAANEYRFQAKAGQVQPVSQGWIWKAPARPGIYPACLEQTKTGEALHVNLVVLAPYNWMRQGWLNHYHIGRYPRVPLHASQRDQPPLGFIEVTPGNQETWLTPHFQLKQFVCKQPGAFPKYIALDVNLLVKLEILLEKVNARYPCRTLAVLSGFRTPYYNRMIGDVEHSSHLWGRAADVYVDEDHDGVMDDLNRDGRHDYQDAQILYEIIEAMDASGQGDVAVGGLGLYDRCPEHGPFVHMDTRGTRARWGLLAERRMAKK
jgi:hypothetical protein